MDALSEQVALCCSTDALAAEFLGLQNEIGTLAPGFEADLLAVEGNPLQDVRALKMSFGAEGRDSALDYTSGSLREMAIRLRQCALRRP